MDELSFDSVLSRNRSCAFGIWWHTIHGTSQGEANLFFLRKQNMVATGVLKNNLSIFLVRIRDDNAASNGLTPILGK